MSIKKIKKLIPIVFIAILFIIMCKGSSIRGFDLYSLLFQPDSINSTSGNSVSDVFAVSEAGAIPYYSPGYFWEGMSSGTTNDLKAVWGSSDTDIFAVGEGGIILHYEGTTWEGMDSGTTNDLNSVWGSSAADVFAVGTSGTILHYEGSNWEAMNSETTNDLTGVWSSSATDVFAVGTDGTILYYNGSGWSAIGSNEARAHLFFGVWGSSANDVLVVGGFTGNEIFHYDGTNWVNTFSESDLNSPYLQAVWGSSGSVVFAVGNAGVIRHKDGLDWPLMESGTTNILRGVWGASGTDVFAVGIRGTIRHYEGTAWEGMDSGTTKHLNGVWGSSASDVFVVGNGGTILSVYSEVTPPPTTSTSIQPATTTIPPATTTVPPATTTVPPATTTVPPATTSIPPATTTSIVECESDVQCDDELFCNGAERCDNGVCQSANDPCEEGEQCDEENDECKIPPAPCEISVEPNTSEVVSGQTLNFTIITTSGDCTNSDYEWSVKSDIESTIDKNGNYVAGTNNDLFATSTDVVSVLEQTSGSEVSATVTVAWKCFLIQLYGEDSEKTELLRNFRDHILRKTPAGREIIRLYYKLSPLIVTTMEKDGAFKDEVRALVEGVLPLIEIQ